MPNNHSELREKIDNIVQTLFLTGYKAGEQGFGWARMADGVHKDTTTKLILELFASELEDLEKKAKAYITEEWNKGEKVSTLTLNVPVQAVPLSVIQEKKKGYKSE